VSIMDFASALRGGGPGGPPGGPGPGGPGPGLLPPGPDPDDVPGHPDDVYDTPMQALDVAEHAIQAFIRMDHDAPDKALAAKALVIVTGLKGSHQTDAAAGGGKSLVRALQGGGGIGVPGG
jgi:hypothetical protein